MIARFAYLHGFASSPRSKKAAALGAAFGARGLALHAPDLRRPSFARLSYAAMLQALDEMDVDVEPAGAPWRLVGSSLGGYLATLFAARRPRRVERLVLLAPGFDLAGRWPALVGDELMRRWREQGALVFPDETGAPVPVHWSFYEESTTMPPSPPASCPTLVLHGARDEVVPIESSRRWVEANPSARLVELDDDHALLTALPRVIDETLAFLLA